MSLADIRSTQNDFVQAALNARACGFDGVEVHAGNGYLFDQFHHSNSMLCHLFAFGLLLSLLIIS